MVMYDFRYKTIQFLQAISQGKKLQYGCDSKYTLTINKQLKKQCVELKNKLILS